LVSAWHKIRIGARLRHDAGRGHRLRIV
jgi:hypothetical protein